LISFSLQVGHLLDFPINIACLESFFAKEGFNLNKPKPPSLLLLLLPLILTMAFSVTVHSTSPSGAALQAFEALRIAEAAGANVTSLASQFNLLLQSSSLDSSFQTLQNDASSAEVAASLHAETSRTLDFVLVPIVALVLTIAAESLIYVRERIMRKRLLSQEAARV